jgi:hypothetical protein
MRLIRNYSREGVRSMGNRVMWWVVALIFGGALTAGTGGPGVVFLVFVFVIGMLNEWGHKSRRRERQTRWNAEDTDEQAVLSGLESTGRPMTVYEIRFREAMKTAHRGRGGG